MTQPHTYPGSYKVPCIWILLVDMQGAEIYKKNHLALKKIGEVLSRGRHKSPTNESVGRAISSADGAIHHKYEPHMNVARQEGLAFAHEISEYLNKAVRENAFDRLVLVAPPKILGFLRKSLSEAVDKRIVAEVNKDLKNLGKKDLEQALAEILWF